MVFFPIQCCQLCKFTNFPCKQNNKKISKYNCFHGKNNNTGLFQLMPQFFTFSIVGNTFPISHSTTCYMSILLWLEGNRSRNCCCFFFVFENHLRLYHKRSTLLLYYHTYIDLANCYAIFLSS